MFLACLLFVLGFGWVSCSLYDYWFSGCLWVYGDAYRQPEILLTGVILFNVNAAFGDEPSPLHFRFQAVVGGFAKVSGGKAA